MFVSHVPFALAHVEGVQQELLVAKSNVYFDVHIHLF